MTKILAFDIGNTRTKIAFLDDKTGAITHLQKYSTHRENIQPILKFLQDHQVSQIIYSSVVPLFDEELLPWLQEDYQVWRPSAQTEITLPQNVTVGDDLIALLLGACAQNEKREKNGGALVVTLGTATTFCLLSPHKTLSGCAIVPGIGVQLESLNTSAAQLSVKDIFAQYDFNKDFSLGRNTEQSVQVGILENSVGGIERIVNKTLASVDYPCEVYLTGGIAESMQTIFPHYVYVADLLFQGLWRGFDKY